MFVPSFAAVLAFGILLFSAELVSTTGNRLLDSNKQEVSDKPETSKKQTNAETQKRKTLNHAVRAGLG